MLARVVCEKCGRDIKIKSISIEDSGILITLENCSKPECSKQESDKNPEYEKHLSDMLMVDSSPDLFMGKDI